MPTPLRVVYLSAALEGYKQALWSAAYLGREEHILLVGKKIDDGLRTTPREFGDPWFSMKHLSLDIFHRMMSPLSVTYGVHQDLPIVFVQKIKDVSPLV